MFPTDAKLVNRARERLVRLAKKLGVTCLAFIKPKPKFRNLSLCESEAWKNKGCSNLTSAGTKSRQANSGARTGTFTDQNRTHRRMRFSVHISIRLIISSLATRSSAWPTSARERFRSIGYYSLTGIDFWVKEVERHANGALECCRRSHVEAISEPHRNP